MKKPSFSFAAITEIPTKIWWWIGIITAMIGGGIAAFFIFYFQIQTIELKRNQSDENVRHTSMIQTLEYVKGYNMILLSTDFLEGIFLTRFPEIESISITKKFPKTLIVESIPDPIQVKWVYTNALNEVQYFGFLNSKHIFLEHGPDQITTIFDLQPRTEQIPFFSKVSDGEHISEILDAKKLLEEATVREMVSISYLRDAQEVHFKDDQGLSYWIFLEEDIPMQIEKLSAMIEEINVFGLANEYIDLRISKKIIYK